MNERRWAQIRGVLRMELRKSLFSRRALPIYLVAALPLVPVLLFVVISSLLQPPQEFRGLGGANLFFIALFLT